MSELPDDLARLGEHLEAAAHAAVRRRTRRQALLNAIGAVSLAVPLAMGVSAAPLAPSEGPVPHDLVSSAVAWTNEHAGLGAAHIPDEPVPALARPCLDAHDCRVPVRSTPFPDHPRPLQIATQHS